MPQPVEPYLRRFGLKPGATLQQITARYFACLEAFPPKMNPEQKAEKARVDHAYAILKRAYTSESPRKPTERKVRRTPRATTRSRAVTTGVVVALFVGAGVLLTMNYSEIKLKLSDYEPGDVVRWEESNSPYGKVLQFDRMHDFGIGPPSPAYEIQLDGTTETVWVGERVVEKAMVPVGSD